MDYILLLAYLFDENCLASCYWFWNIRFGIQSDDTKEQHYISLEIDKEEIQYVAYMYVALTYTMRRY